MRMTESTDCKNAAVDPEKQRDMFVVGAHLQSVHRTAPKEVSTIVLARSWIDVKIFVRILSSSKTV